MGKYKYSYQGDKSAVALSSGTSLTISLKKTVETAKAIKGKSVSYALHYLEEVTKEKKVVPYTRYKAEMGHKRGKGIDSGGFPVNVAKELLRLVKSAQSNAKEKELGDSLKIVSVSARKGPTRYIAGRYSGRKTKSTNVEIVLAAAAKKTVKAPTKKSVSKSESQSPSDVGGSKE